ncbi:hypothetical protein AQUCO_01000704v1 [Aquilegia coerulea]|uniref:C2H2-type domain-containing protein n=1 Tax=Aquilegia coerulea TaxID=218851 RepID=A0A2G5EBS2_AQUCA|nr:hypothetical protein AQUCO_01000704v1 [Aquilegia coerulea]
MKRSLETTETLKTMAADCLMLLSHQGEMIESLNRSSNRSFVCKTCNRHFSSFQALGGHRASHKKPRGIGGDQIHQVLSSSQTKSKAHECSICGLEFAIGQALGGHMRRHRAIMSSSSSKSFTTTNPPPLPSKVTSVPAVFRRSNSSKRIVSLDLNLTPLENGLEFRPIKVGFLANIKSPVIHSFI